MSAADDIRRLLADHPLPGLGGDKRERGTLVVVGGPPSCPGGALLAGVAALRCGAGRVQLVVDPAVAVAVAVTFPEALVVGWEAGTDVPDDLAERFEQAAAVVVGPGMAAEGPAAARAAAAHVPPDVPLLLDATALAAATELQGPARRLVLSPNPTEAGRLLDDDVEDDEDGVAGAAVALAERFGAPVAVRGGVTAVAEPGGGVWTVASGSPGLGTAGSGDVAAGALAGFLARGADELTALGWAVAVHAEAGALAGADIGDVGFLAREVADRLPRALSILSNG